MSHTCNNGTEVE